MLESSTYLAVHHAILVTMWRLIGIHLQAWNLGEPLSQFPPSSRNFHSRRQKNKVHDQSGHETLAIHLQKSLQKRTQKQRRLQRVLMVGSSLANSTLAHLTHLHHRESLLPLLRLNSGGTQKGDSHMLPQLISDLFFLFVFAKAGASVTASLWHTYAISLSLSLKLPIVHPGWKPALINSSIRVTRVLTPISFLLLLG